MRGTTTGRRRGMRLAVAGVAAASLAVGGITAAGAVTGPAPAAVTVDAVAVGGLTGGQVTAGPDVQQLAMGQYVVRFDIKRTGRTARAVLADVTDKGRFNQIFPIKGAKTNLGRVGTIHPLRILLLGAPVKVSNRTGISWIFQTLPPHFDYPGQVGFGLSGGTGAMLRLTVIGKCPLCGTKAYRDQAQRTWAPFAANIRIKVRL